MAPKITLYSDRQFGGTTQEMTGSCSDMLNVGYDQTAVGVTVEEGVWVLFQEPYFRGKIWVVIQGEKIEYLRWFNKMTRSIKLLDDYDFYAEPEIKIFKGNYSGHTATLHKDVSDLSTYRFLRQVSSVEVSRGAWIGYDGRGYRGKATLFLKGDFEEDSNSSPCDGGFASNGGISALRKIQIFPVGKLKLSKPISYDLENAKITKTPISVFQWTQTNNTRVQQNVSRTEMHQITKDNTYEFRWDSSSKMTASLEVTAGIPQIGVEAKLGISVEKMVNIGTTEKQSVSETQNWTAEYPSAIPAESTIKLTSTLTEGHFIVPFTAVFTRGDEGTHKEIKTGKFIGVQFYGFETKFDQVVHPHQVLHELGKGN
ncbi:epidermal differentiation-specific protein-like [Mytilus californianus]|uniref:epidermal differentiation-specific protein-like n=1 Tax=Mytilus californianus TaxID=6549 RepID=UPI0022452676|nr:epidermal differentiation-specific protein-like [Mytilus californianus]